MTTVENESFELVRFVGVSMNALPPTKDDDDDDGPWPMRHISVQIALSLAVDVQHVITVLTDALTKLDQEAHVKLDDVEEEST